MPGTLGFRELGQMAYEPVWHAMQRFTNERGSDAADEIWLVEHPPVFTQGQAGKAEHLLLPGDIPVVQVDRGGQVTYHARANWWLTCCWMCASWALAYVIWSRAWNTA